jgi:hypothetical protein
MAKRGELRHFIGAFLVAILLYVVAFHLIEHRRAAKGPWVVSFVQNKEGAPTIVINHPEIGITNAKVLFEGAITNEMSETLRFDTARPVPFSVPFGECVFLDTSFLPGTVTLRCFGHEIEMIPRVLIVDHQEHRWGETIKLPRREDSGRL